MKRIAWMMGILLAVVIFGSLICIKNYRTPTPTTIEQYQAKNDRIIILIDESYVDEELWEELLEAFDVYVENPPYQCSRKHQYDGEKEVE